MLFDRSPIRYFFKLNPNFFVQIVIVMIKMQFNLNKMFIFNIYIYEIGLDPQKDTSQIIKTE